MPKEISRNRTAKTPKRAGAIVRPLVLVIGVTFACRTVSTAQSTPPGNAQSSAGTALVLRGGTLIDGTGKTPLRDAVVVIRGNRIEAVGPRTRVSAPAGAQVLDTSNQFILPGLIESHFHFADWMPGEMFLAFGLSSVVHFGAPIQQAKPPSEGNPTWPRVFFSGRSITTPDEWTTLGKVLGQGTARTVEEAREQVKQRKAAGASFIQVGEALTTEMLAAVTQEAHALGLSVVGHQVNAAEAVKAGLDGVEHMTGVALACIPDQNLLDRLAELQRKGPTDRAVSHPISNPEFHMDPGEVRKLIRLMVDRRAYLNPTLLTRWQRVFPQTPEFHEQYMKMLERPEWQAIPERVRLSWMNTLIPYPVWPDEEHRQQEREGYRKTQEFLRDFAKAGGKIFAGSDFAGASVPGLRLHQELVLLADAGLTPMEVILAATRYPAEFLHLDKELGTVEPGKLADIIVVDADPLQRIENLRRISRVVLDGKLVSTRFRPDSIDVVPSGRR